MHMDRILILADRIIYLADAMPRATHQGQQVHHASIGYFWGNFEPTENCWGQGNLGKFVNMALFLYITEIIFQ